MHLYPTCEILWAQYKGQSKHVKIVLLLTKNCILFISKFIFLPNCAKSQPPPNKPLAQEKSREKNWTKNVWQNCSTFEYYYYKAAAKHVSIYKRVHEQQFFLPKMAHMFQVRIFNLTQANLLMQCYEYFIVLKSNFNIPCFHWKKQKLLRIIDFKMCILSKTSHVRATTKSSLKAKSGGNSVSLCNGSFKDLFPLSSMNIRIPGNSWMPGALLIYIPSFLYSCIICPPHSMRA